MSDPFLSLAGIVVMALLLAGLYVMYSDFREGPQ